MNTEFGLKELYDTRIKATYPMKINNREIEPGETIALFDKIQIANFDEVKSFVAATGGFDNRPHVIWQDTKALNLVFTQGIFSRTQFALLSNSKLVQLTDNSFYITKREIVSPDEDGKFQLEFEPTCHIFCYDKDFNKVQASFDGKYGQVDPIFTSIIVDYDYLYENVAVDMKIGSQLTNGYLSLEGKTRVKDDITGKTRTGILKIPKLKLMSSLTMSLGENALPVVANFKCMGCPVGVKGNTTVMEMIYLNDDIDAELD